MRKLLAAPDYSKIVSGMMDPFDVELMIDFNLYVRITLVRLFGTLIDPPKLLRNNSLSNSGVQDCNRKARTLMFKLITETNVIPKSLFISDVKIDTELGATNIGGIGRVFRGEHKGQVVALKLLDKGHDKDVCVSLPPPSQY